MKPVFVDIHIHTSENPNQLNDKYDCDSLIKNVKKIAGDAEFLLSFTDHNSINKKAYLELKQKTENIILGVELHIRNDVECPPYHCHILFNVPIDETIIDNINRILDKLYPNKIIDDSVKDLPTIERISSEFDSFDYLLLPHGGQSHKTFDKSIKAGRQFDTTIERSIYYNQFDGFTSRSNTGLEETQKYFKRLGINEFVNLLTCTDNYNPTKYPSDKSGSNNYIPTWMYASPSFEGLRLSLSESSRLKYSDVVPENWDEFIDEVYLKNDKIDINVKLTPGLNVVIGGSSSGKTLFVDSLYRKISGDYEGNKYSDFNNDQIVVNNPSNMVPHYIHQNFIVSIIQNKDKDISDIPLLTKVFPEDSEIDRRIKNSLSDFRKHVTDLTVAISEIEDAQDELSRIPSPNRLIIPVELQQNIVDELLPSAEEFENTTISDQEAKDYIDTLRELQVVFQNNPFALDMNKEITMLIQEIERLADISSFSKNIHAIIYKSKNAIDQEQLLLNKEGQSKKENREKLIIATKKYIKNAAIFYKELKHISEYNVKCETRELTVNGHTLSIENEFALTPNIIIDAINELLKKEYRIEKLEDIVPERLFKKNYRERNPIVKDYNTFTDKLCSKINDFNKKKYKIITKNGEKFEELSPGWKSAIILDLLLGYDEDVAPIIIDQPEDNLATNYINRHLVELIKLVKRKKQIILVSHNATIPMLGDAQNVVLCRSLDEKIIIRSEVLEGTIDNKSIVDYIAEITDGGKASIKKRVKKYNLKSFKE